MTKLYLDCDGVILDTINMSYKMIKNKGLTNEKDIEHFYKNLSWEELIIEAGEINNSIEKIKELTKVYDVEILTHVNSDGEIIAKLNYFKEVLPEVKVIAVFGLGTLGKSLAISYSNMGGKVIAIDKSQEKVDELSDYEVFNDLSECQCHDRQIVAFQTQNVSPV
mgnify:CR=1 FL=1